MACPHCGSWSVRADRSLAGRLVCGRCGRPLQGVSPRRRVGRPPSGRPTPLVSWRLGLLSLVAVAAALAALRPAGVPPSAPESSNGPLLWRHP